MSSDQLATMLDLIAAGPDLRRGLCIGQWDLWDQTTDPAATEHAVGLCHQCPVLDDCRGWFNSLPRTKRPVGVVAGRLNKGPQSVREAAA